MAHSFSLLFERLQIKIHLSLLCSLNFIPWHFPEQKKLLKALRFKLKCLTFSKKQALIKNLGSHAKAKFLEQEIERHLNIQDRDVIT